MIVKLILAFIIGSLIGKIWKRRPSREPAQTTSPIVEQKSAEETYRDWEEGLIIRHGMKSIDRVIKKCEYREDQREGLTFKYWRNSDGEDVKMERSDGGGFIQLCNKHGQVFAAIFISPGEPPTAASIQGAGSFQENMRWFMAYV